MRRFIVLVAVLLVYASLTAQQAGYSLRTSDSISYTEIRKGFIQPPQEAKLRCYWWWLNSMATKASITRDLEEMKANGYGGASIVDAGSSNYAVANKTQAGPVFMSPEWMDLYKHAVSEAQRLGIELSVNVQSGWNPGGPMITPELALKRIVFSVTTIEGGKKVEITLPQPAYKLLYKDIAVQAFKEPAGFLLKDSAIKNWGIKSFNQSFGFRGTYPLYKLREEDVEKENTKGIATTGIVDLTATCKDGVLNWDVPAGKWTIIRYGWTCTGASTSTNSDGWEGLSLDHLNPQAFKKFSADVIVPLIETAKSAGNSLHFLQTDSWEMGNVGWTNNFPAEFKKFRGYNLFPYLPVLAGYVVGTVEQSNRFLHDYRQTIGDCVATYHYQLFSDLAHARGLGIHPESGGPHSAPVDALKVMAINDFPQGEFWATSNTHRVKDDERLVVKQSASVAHTNAKRYVGAEGPTTIGPQWERAPRELKANIDRVFCSGVNRIVWHTFTSSPKEFGLPGNEYFAGTHLNPNVTWWKQAGDFINYLNRCSYLLAQGLFVGDVLYYYGDDVPSFVFTKEDIKDLALGYDWDKCSKDALLKNVTVRDHTLLFRDGTSYRLLVLPNEKSIDLALLRKLELLVKAGLTIIAPRPVKSNSMTDFPLADKEIAAIAARMWGKIDGMQITENKYGNGKVIFGKDVNTVLKEMQVLPDFSFAGTRSETAIDYIHRKGKEADIYFLSNRFAQKGINDFEFRYTSTLPDRFEQVECAFRVSGMVPEVWDPVTGEIKEIEVWREEKGRTVIPLFFEPEGSKFIIFRKKVTAPHVVSIAIDGKSFFPGNQQQESNQPSIDFNIAGSAMAAVVTKPGNYRVTWSNGTVNTIDATQPVTIVPVTGPWQIRFDTAWGGPAQIKVDTLQSWTVFFDPGVKYYSGTAVYNKKFTISNEHVKDAKVMLDLGNVLEMASLTINGKKLPVRWCAPFQYEVTGYIHAGENEMEVTVVNLWPNRLIGDSKLPEWQRRTKTNVKKFDQPDADKYLRPSGLLGPVTLQMLEKRMLKPVE
ncbi:glycoside hydrolase family 2 [Niastella yeongjuensis]|uniref:Glycoside hydrolase family 2 n=1 Tax=Niastella yeongjuensis TaxID=354355 RepID=A0A1V9DXX6_9BACT|nr:glycosyl hydrolase [Niastella yeongjuensis]OQP38614.1 glycoside hydrolase family 2 [Niastella yeongjuensis]SEO39451.1 Glycosyl hydrolases family 2, sugar binding domain [Niastella yeongjuensis]